MTKSLICTWAYAALYCCIWFAPGIIAGTHRGLLGVLRQPVSEWNSRVLLKIKICGNVLEFTQNSANTTPLSSTSINTELLSIRNASLTDFIVWPSKPQFRTFIKWENLCFLFTVSACCWSEKRKRESLEVRMRHFQGGILGIVRWSSRRKSLKQQGQNIWTTKRGIFAWQFSILYLKLQLRRQCDFYF